MHSKTLPSTPVHGVGLFIFLIFCVTCTLPLDAAESTAAAVPVDDLEAWLGDDPETENEPHPAASWRWRMSTGIEYAEGDYGTSEHSDAWVQTLSTRAGKGDWTFGLNASYQWITGPTLNPLIFDDLGLFFEDYLDSDSLFVQRSEKGFGDVSASARYAPATDVFDGWYPSIAVKVKLPVGNDALSTGKTDVTFTTDIAKMLGDWSVFALVSHTVRGDNAALPRRNTFAGSLGADYRFNADWNAGVSYDIRETSSVTGSTASSAFVYGRYRVSRAFSVLGYTSVGLDNNGPDTTVGLRLTWKGVW